MEGRSKRRRIICSIGALIAAGIMAYQGHHWLWIGIGAGIGYTIVDGILHYWTDL
jgi:hypothetical protein